MKPIKVPETALNQRTYPSRPKQRPETLMQMLNRVHRERRALNQIETQKYKHEKEIETLISRAPKGQVLHNE